MLIQLALDMVPLGEGIQIAAAVADRIDIIEVGTPMIYRYGLLAVTEMKRAFPGHKILFDGKIADAGAEESKMAFDAGADIVTVLATANDATIQAAVGEAQKCGKQVLADLLGTQDIAGRSGELLAMGVDYIGIHIAVDIQSIGQSFDREFIALQGVVPVYKIAVAGGINPDTALKIAKYTPGIVIVGGAVTKAENRLEIVDGIRTNLEAGRQ